MCRAWFSRRSWRRRRRRENLHRGEAVGSRFALLRRRTNTSLLADIGSILDDEIHNGLWILGAERIVPFTLLEDDGDPSAEFLVSALGDPRLGFEPRIEASANVKELDAGFCQRRQIVQWLVFRHVAAQDRILPV